MAWHTGWGKGKPKLTDDQVREVRRLSREGRKHKDIAVQFGVSPSQISNCVSRMTYTHVLDK